MADTATYGCRSFEDIQRDCNKRPLLGPKRAFATLLWNACFGVIRDLSERQKSGARALSLINAIHALKSVRIRRKTEELISNRGAMPLIVCTQLVLFT